MSERETGRAGWESNGEDSDERTLREEREAAYRGRPWGRPDAWVANYRQELT